MKSHTNILSRCCLISLVLFMVSSCDGNRDLTIHDLRCEYMSNPLGIEISKPHLSWIIKSNQRGEKQTAYHMLVASSPEKLNKNIGDLWDSEKLISDQSVHVEYKGKPLKSRMPCYWKVRIWDKDGKVSKWSETAEWSMGLLKPEDWKSRWIGSADTCTAPYYRQSFNLDQIPERAVVYLAALGYFELYVNGEKVGKEVLAPAVSNYSKRSYYRTYDVSSFLKKGTNSLGIRMGTGWYSPGLPGVKHHSPVVRAQLDLYDKGNQQWIITDTSWETKASERKLLGEWRWGKFGGEQLDARNIDLSWWQKEISKQNWEPVIEVAVANVPCSAQSCDGNTGFEVITPQSIEKLDDETILVDFGTNLTGMMQMSFHDLKAGQKISMYYADLDGRPEDEKWRALMTKKDFAVYGQWDEFISAGAEEETFENVFNYHAFRYVLIDGLSYLPVKKDMAAVAIETKVAETGTFSCSNDLYNRIHKMVRWTYRCLNLGGQTVDCPHRERLGYGDGQTIMDLGCYNFDAVPLYAKWSRNWWDEQKEDGYVPFTAPCPHGTGGGPAWGAMCIVVPWKTYLFSNDLRLLEEGYLTMKNYIEYLNSYCKDGVLQDIFPGERWDNLGDWVPPLRGMDKKDWVDDSSRQFFNNCYRIHLLQIMQKIGRLLGNEDDVEAFEKAMSFSQKKVHESWFNPEDNTYANGEQPYLIFPLQTGITPEPLRDAVFDKYVETLMVEDKGHLNTGMVGTQIMTDYLLETNRNDLIDTYVNKKTYPGWGYMVEKGATTCWEQWNGYYSQIHSCFPYIGGWFYRGLGGIQWDPENPGFKNFILRPGLVESVEWVNCTYKSPYGEIVSNWKIEANQFTWKVNIPVNSTAIIYVQGNEITEDGIPVDEAVGVGFIKNEEGASVYELESGSYTFRSNLDQKYSDGRPEASLRMDAKDHGIVLKYGNGPDSCDVLGARDVWVFEDNGIYYMHYDAAGPKGWLSSLAISKDLINWEKKGPILDFGAAGEEDSKGACYGVTYKEGDQWHMFYLGTPNVSPSPDLIPSFPYLTMKAKGSSPTGPWIKQKDVDPFRPKQDTYYSLTASPGHIIRHGEEYLQFFSSTTEKEGNPCVQRSLGIARTKDLDSFWTIDPKPIVPIEEQIENSTLYFEETINTWFLFTNHIGIDDGLEFTDAIWVYWSKDLNKWNPEDKAIVLDGQNCSWSKECIGLPSVLQVGNRLALFYDAPGGNSFSHMKRSVGLAWLDLPLSPPLEVQKDLLGK